MNAIAISFTYVPMLVLFLMLWGKKFVERKKEQLDTLKKLDKRIEETEEEKLKTETSLLTIH